MKPEERSIDPAAQKMLKKAEKENIEVTWDRLRLMEPQCGFGQLGLCCTTCHMGPCRIDPFGEGPRQGVCGANAETIIARNLLRHIAAGCAAHSDHGRDVAHTLLMVAEGKTHDYQVTDENKLRFVAGLFGIKVDGKSQDALASEVAKTALAEFGQQEGELKFTHRAPIRRQEIWRKLAISPRGIDREVVEAMHRVNMGVDTDYKNIIMQGLRCSLADGWGGSMIATELQDVILGSPQPIRGRVNLGVLKEDEVNVVIHGHEPTLPDAVVRAAKDAEIIELAKKEGAKGVNVVGMCCTANEVLMRHGVPVAGNFLSQELAIVTGAVEVLMVDVQCIMPALVDVASCFHTMIVTTSPKAKFPGVNYVEFKEEQAYQIAKDILKMAIKNYRNRKSEKVDIPKEEIGVVVGFSAENTFHHLGGRFRATYRPLNDAIISGRLRGVAGVVGCNNPKIPQDYGHINMVKELIKHDVLVVQTGCSALACGKQGLLQPESASKYAGKGLQEICEAVGIPPVLHLGSCVDNTRILIACCEMIKEGGLGDDISQLPVAGAAPEWMSEKAITIGFYVVASGIFTVFSHPFGILGSSAMTNFLTQEFEKVVGAIFAFEADPIKAAHLMIDHIDKKRQELKLKPMMYEAKEKVEVGI